MLVELKVTKSRAWIAVFLLSGFISDIADLDLVNRLSAGKVDLTYGR
jgi:hypothetical protein